MDVSIIIPARNEERNIGICLDAVFSQQTSRSFEVLVIDSESTDRTVEIASRYPIKLMRIAAEDFHHGRTRNLGARHGSGAFIVFLSADAFPTSSSWLEALLSPFESDEKTAAVYGRQIAKPDAKPERVFFMNHRYGSQRIIQDASGNCPQYRLYQFSSVNSALRRTIWEQVQYPEDLNAYEDFSLAVRLVQKWRIIYEPNAAVQHSHNYRLYYSFKQYFDNGVVYRRRGLFDQHANDDMGNIRRDGLQYVLKEMRYLARAGAWIRIPYVLSYEVARFLGIYLGRHEHLIPLKVKRRFSSHRLFG